LETAFEIVEEREKVSEGKVVKTPPKINPTILYIQIGKRQLKYGCR
jgi:hypothetical protein